ncbi:MAG: phospholipase [Micavibrio aeruginosavorus]|uniref:Phospholipase n=1 Tax=Micavibrio aeruginosavorus TaxID=349221 RepID=A0A2W5PNL8_9BACT|nr:MAG: phospholipase [Micavibrio aeruginosavorus]
MDTDFKHIFVPGDLSLPVLLLLHGTGGDEHDLVELGQSVSPGSAILSVRGKVLENGMPRFFRRLAEGVFDLADLNFRTNELADFIAQARVQYGLSESRVIAMGYSNGANIVASILFSRPEALQGAILLRAMVPFRPKELPDLRGKKILMLSGLMDQIIPIENSKTLTGLLQDAGADVTFDVKPAGHGLTQADFLAIKNWMLSANIP